MKKKNSWSYVTIRELQARKHNQFSAIKNVFGERQDSEKTDIS
jgi:predicted CopG family antitoxin